MSEGRDYHWAVSVWVKEAYQVLAVLFSYVGWQRGISESRALYVWQVYQKVQLCMGDREAYQELQLYMGEERFIMQLCIGYGGAYEKV